MSIENIIVDLIKNGDKNTINTVISLLEFVRDYKKPETKTTTKPIQKPVQQAPKPQQKQIQQPSKKPQPKPVVEGANEMMRASAILDEHYKNGGQLRSQSKFRQPTVSNVEVKPIEEDDMNINHADALL